MSNKKDVILAITEREVSHFREQLSRIIRNVKLVREGSSLRTTTEDRLDRIQECAYDLDNRCIEL